MSKQNPYALLDEDSSSDEDTTVQVVDRSKQIDKKRSVAGATSLISKKAANAVEWEEVKSAKQIAYEIRMQKRLKAKGGDDLPEQLDMSGYYTARPAQKAGPRTKSIKRAVTRVERDRLKREALDNELASFEEIRQQERQKHMDQAMRKRARKEKAPTFDKQELLDLIKEQVYHAEGSFMTLAAVGSALQTATSKSWNKSHKKQFGTLRQFVGQNAEDLGLVMTSDNGDTIYTQEKYTELETARVERQTKRLAKKERRQQKAQEENLSLHKGGQTKRKSSSPAHSDTSCGDFLLTSFCTLLFFAVVLAGVTSFLIDNGTLSKHDEVFGVYVQQFIRMRAEVGTQILQAQPMVLEKLDQMRTPIASVQAMVLEQLDQVRTQIAPVQAMVLEQLDQVRTQIAQVQAIVLEQFDQARNK